MTLDEAKAATDVLLPVKKQVFAYTNLADFVHQMWEIEAVVNASVYYTILPAGTHTGKSHVRTSLLDFWAGLADGSIKRL